MGVAHSGGWRNTTQKRHSLSPSFLPPGSRGSRWRSWLPWCSRGQGTCPAPFPLFLLTAPQTVPPSLLRGVSHPHPLLLSVEAKKGQAFHSSRLEGKVSRQDAELGVQFQLEIGGEAENDGETSEIWEGAEDQDPKGRRQSSAASSPGGEPEDGGREMAPSFPWAPLQLGGSARPSSAHRVLPRINRGQGRPAGSGKGPRGPSGDSGAHVPWEFSPEMNKEPPCGHWHQVASPLPGFPWQPDSV